MKFQIVSSIGGPAIYIVDDSGCGEIMRIGLPKDFMHEIAFHSARWVLNNGTTEQKDYLHETLKDSFTDMKYSLDVNGVIVSQFIDLAMAREAAWHYAGDDIKVFAIPSGKLCYEGLKS